MKKIIAILLAAMMVLGMAACGTTEPATTTGAPAPETTGAAGETTVATDPVETTTPADVTVSADDIPDEMTSEDGKYLVAFITDVGQLKDQSFNQGTYDGVKLYAAANGKSYKYYQPANGDAATDEDRIAAMKLAC